MNVTSDLNVLRSDRKKALFSFLLFVLLSAIFSCLAVWCVGEDLNFDLMYYHFYTGYVWSRGLAFSDSIATLGSYLEVPLNCFYYDLITKTSPLNANCIISVLESFAISATWLLGYFLLSGEKIWTRIALSSVFAALSFIGPVFWSELGSTMGDSTTALLVVFSLIFALEGYIKHHYTKVLISGILIGIASGLKLTNLTFFVGIASAILLSGIYEWNIKKLIACGVVFFLASFIGFLAIYFPTGIVLFHKFESPIFPYFNGIFKSPYASIVNIEDPRWIPHHFKEYLELPFKFAIQYLINDYTSSSRIGLEINFKTVYPAILFVVSPIFIIWQFINKYSNFKRHRATKKT